MDEPLVEYYFEKLLREGLGLNTSDPNLSGTPRRVAKMYCREFLSSVGEEYCDFKSFPNIYGYNQIIMLDRIFFVSLCMHHFLPFTGNAWILYIPKGKLVGASKMARLVTHYAKRPQLQESLCHEIVESLNKEVQPEGAMVVLRAEHGCMRCRGVNQYGGAGMLTSAVKGSFLSGSDLELKGLEMVKLSLLI